MEVRSGGWRGEGRWKRGGRGRGGRGMNGGNRADFLAYRARPEGVVGLEVLGWRTLEGGLAGEGGWGMREGKCRQEAGGCGMEGRARTIASTGEAALVRFTITAEDTGLDQKRART